jgi:hypothetical protein
MALNLPIGLPVRKTNPVEIICLICTAIAVHFGLANFPVAYCGLKIITSLSLRFPDFQRQTVTGFTLVRVIVATAIAVREGG